MSESVDEMILSLPRNEQMIVKRLRSVVKECLPRATEKLSYGVPYYTRNRMMCFIWPPSVSWGPKKDEAGKKGVVLGFCHGNRFANDKGLLLAEGRKQVYCMYFKQLSEIDDHEIQALLFEAEMIDDSFVRKKTKR